MLIRRSASNRYCTFCVAFWDWWCAVCAVVYLVAPGCLVACCCSCCCRGDLGSCTFCGSSTLATVRLGHYIGREREIKKKKKNKKKKSADMPIQNNEKREALVWVYQHDEPPAEPTRSTHNLTHDDETIDHLTTTNRLLFSSTRTANVVDTSTPLSLKVARIHPLSKTRKYHVYRSTRRYKATGVVL